MPAKLCQWKVHNEHIPMQHTLAKPIYRLHVSDKRYLQIIWLNSVFLKIRHDQNIFMRSEMDSSWNSDVIWCVILDCRIIRTCTTADEASMAAICIYRFLAGKAGAQARKMRETFGGKSRCVKLCIWSRISSPKVLRTDRERVIIIG